MAFRGNFGHASSFALYVDSRQGLDLDAQPTKTFPVALGF